MWIDLFLSARLTQREAFSLVLIVIHILGHSKYKIVTSISHDKFTNPCYKLQRLLRNLWRTQKLQSIIFGECRFKINNACKISRVQITTRANKVCMKKVSVKVKGIILVYVFLRSRKLQLNKNSMLVFDQYNILLYYY